MSTFENLETIRLEESGSIATITLIAEHSSMKMIKEMGKVLDHLEDNSKASIVVLKGTDGRFNLGLDFKEFTPGQNLDIHGFHKWEKMCVRLERMRALTISLLNGHTVGGGVQLALCTDLRIAHPQTTFQLPEVKMGFLPGMGIYRIAKNIGLGRAKQWVLQSSTLSASQALQWGIISDVSEDLEGALQSHIEASSPVNPVAIQLARRLLNESFHDSFEDAIGHFLAAQQRAISHDQFLKTVDQHS
jgi:enoyl-CoA hydratase/carnithine racemase